VSDEARQLDAQIRDTISTLTDKDVRTQPPDLATKKGCSLRPGQLVLAVAFLATLAFLWFLVRAMSEESDDASSPTPTPVPGQTVATDGSDGTDTGDAGDCSVGDAVQLASVTTEEVAGTGGRAVMMYTGEMTITNTSDEEVYVAMHEALSTGRGGMTSDTWTGAFLFAPGESRTEIATAETFTDGDVTWGLVTEVASFAGTPACLEQLGGGDAAALAPYTQPMPNPFPVGP